MFNLSGSEIVFLLLIALIVLGPEKLPEAVRKFGQVYAEIKKMSSGFQSELKSALDEPMREMRETAEAFKNAANFDFKFDTDEPAVASPPEPDKTPEAVAEPAEAATPEPSNAEGEAIIPVADQDPKVVETVEESANE
ncbi:MAG: Sec-independent protein translocase protein TatB [Ilumatobacteraceae bacterium]